MTVRWHNFYDGCPHWCSRVLSPVQVASSAPIEDSSKRFASAGVTPSAQQPVFKLGSEGYRPIVPHLVGPPPRAVPILAAQGPAADHAEVGSDAGRSVGTSSLAPAVVRSPVMVSVSMQTEDDCILRVAQGASQIVAQAYSCFDFLPAALSMCSFTGSFLNSSTSSGAAGR